MNFSELKTEFFARGTDYLNEDAQGVARAERWLNQAYREIASYQAWPFLQSNAFSAVNAGQVVVPDLRKVLEVVELSSFPQRKLHRISGSDMVMNGMDPNLTGTPYYYWIEYSNTIRTYPAGGTLGIRYIRRPALLSGTDVPVFDPEYHDLIVDRAMIKAYKDSDNFEAAAALQQEFDAGMRTMAEDYLPHARDIQYIVPSDPTDG